MEREDAPGAENEPLDREQRTLIERLALALERARIGEYVRLTQDPLRLVYVSFISGMARGLGFALGFTVLGALVIYVLQRIVALNLPGIGRVIAELIRIVQQNMIR